MLDPAYSSDWVLESDGNAGFLRWLEEWREGAEHGSLDVIEAILKDLHNRRVAPRTFFLERHHQSEDSDEGEH